MHHGDVEFIAWDGTSEIGGALGWGSGIKCESEDMKKYEDEFSGGDSKLFNYWPQAYRWTCCGMDASTVCLMVAITTARGRGLAGVISANESRSSHFLHLSPPCCVFWSRDLIMTNC